MCCASADTSIPAVVRVSGARSNVGKTTLIELLIPQLAARGLRVGTIKHTHHGFELDHPGKDSDRHRVAGATATVLVGPSSTAVLLNQQPRMELEEAVARLRGDVDLVLAEGFRSDPGFGIRLDPDHPERLTIGDDGIAIGVLPDTLAPQELQRLADACAAQRSMR